MSVPIATRIAQLREVIRTLVGIFPNSIPKMVHGMDTATFIHTRQGREVAAILAATETAPASEAWTARTEATDALCGPAGTFPEAAEDAAARTTVIDCITRARDLLPRLCIEAVQSETGGQTLDVQVCTVAQRCDQLAGVPWLGCSLEVMGLLNSLITNREYTPTMANISAAAETKAVAAFQRATDSHSTSRIALQDGRVCLAYSIIHRIFAHEAGHHPSYVTPLTLFEIFEGRAKLAEETHTALVRNRETMGQTETEAAEDETAALAQAVTDIGLDKLMPELMDEITMCYEAERRHAAYLQAHAEFLAYDATPIFDRIAELRAADEEEARLAAEETTRRQTRSGVFAELTAARAACAAYTGDDEEVFARLQSECIALQTAFAATESTSNARIAARASWTPEQFHAAQEALEAEVARLLAPRTALLERVQAARCALSNYGTDVEDAALHTLASYGAGNA